MLCERLPFQFEVCAEKPPTEVHHGEVDGFTIVDRVELVIGLGGKDAKFHESPGSNSKILVKFPPSSGTME